MMIMMSQEDEEEEAVEEDMYDPDGPGDHPFNDEIDLLEVEWY